MKLEKKIKRVNLSATIDEDIIEHARTLAQKTDRSVSDVINHMLRQSIQLDKDLAALIAECSDDQLVRAGL